MDYQKQAKDFCNKYKVIMTIEKSPFQSPPLWIKNEKEDYGLRYTITIKRGKEKWTFPFWDSINNKINRERPKRYDILACITKDDPEDYESFCHCYGYEVGEKGTKNIYNAVVKEWENVKRLFGDCLDELRDIC